MTRIIDIMPEDDQKKERILHAVKRVANARTNLDVAIDELIKEVIFEYSNGITEFDKSGTPVVV